MTFHPHIILLFDQKGFLRRIERVYDKGQSLIDANNKVLMVLRNIFEKDFTIFKDKLKAIEVCTNRFDEDTKNSFVELYTKVDGGATADTIAEDQRKAEVAEQVKEDESDSKDDADESNDTSAHI